jgi:hypothetical protein
MNFPAVQICLSFAEAEAAHSRFPEIGVAHYRVRVCKSVEVSVSELFEEERPKLKARHGLGAAVFWECGRCFPGWGLRPIPSGSPPISYNKIFPVNSKASSLQLNNSQTSCAWKWRLNHEPVSNHITTASFPPQMDSYPP